MNEIIRVGEQSVLSVIDIVLLVVYIFIIKFSFQFYMQSYGTLSIYYRRNFYLRIHIMLIHFLIQALYYGYGDTFSYYRDATIMRSNTNDIFDFFSYVFLDQEGLSSNLSVFSEIQHPSTFFVGKITYILGFITFNSYLGISLLFSFFAFLGLWKFYLLISSYFEDKKNYFLYVICFFPSTIFWSSLILKDSLCIGAIGFVCYYVNLLIIKKRLNISQILMMLFSLYLLVTVKAYILIFLLLAVFFTIFVRKYRQWKNPIYKLIVIIFFIILSPLVTRYLFSIYQDYDVDKAIEKAQQYQEFQTQFTEMGDAGSGYSISFEPSIIGILKAVPSAIVVTIFRPFIWEIRSPFMLLQSLEGIFTFLLCFLIMKKHGLRKVFMITTNNFLLLMSITFVILFAFIVGITSYNFGTLARYKIPLIPFLYTYLIYFLYLPKSNVECQK